MAEHDVVSRKTCTVCGTATTQPHRNNSACIAALRGRLERAESDRETLTRLVTATEQRRDEYRDMMYAERGRAERYREALETLYRGTYDPDAHGLGDTLPVEYTMPPSTNRKVRALIRQALAATGDEEGKGGDRA